MNTPGGKVTRGKAAGESTTEPDGEEDDALSRAGLSQAVAGLRDALEAQALLVLVVDGAGVAILASFEPSSRAEHIASLELLVSALTLARQKALSHIDRLSEAPPPQECN